MTTNELALLVTILLLFPMLYFLLVTPTFLLRPLSDPIVAWLLRGLFNLYFRVVSVACALAATAYLLASRPTIASASVFWQPSRLARGAGSCRGWLR